VTTPIPVLGPSDSELVACVLAGQRDAYETIVERYQERLYRYALTSTRDPDSAADLVQDTFVRAYSSLARCRDRERFAPWLFRILRNRCIDHQKEHRRRDVPLDDRSEHASSIGNPEREMDQSILRDALEHALSSLPETAREAFLLKHVQGLSYEEIAEILEVGTSALKMRVARARDVLQGSLRGMGYERNGVM
jgi:RNA polymerase sigma-70 factor (ECF subfamily)